MAFTVRRGGRSAGPPLTDIHLPKPALAGLRRRFDDLQGPGSRTLAHNVRDLLLDWNEVDRLVGDGINGKPLAPLRAERRGKYRGAPGPPLLPFGVNSDAIRGFNVVVNRRHGFWGAWQLRAFIRSPKAEIFVYHKRGIRTKTGLVKRNILGITPKTRAILHAEFRRWAKEGRRYR